MIPESISPLDPAAVAHAPAALSRLRSRKIFGRQGNAWITNTLGTGLDLLMKLRLLELKLTDQMGQFHRVVFDYLNGNPALGSISMLHPNGTPAPGSPFHGGGSWGSWAVVIDGNDMVWSRLAM